MVEFWCKKVNSKKTAPSFLNIHRECVRNVDLQVQVHPGEFRSQNMRVHIIIEASKSAGAKGDVLKICGFVHPLHPCYRIP